MKFLLVVVALLALFSVAKAQDSYCSTCELLVQYTEFIMEFTGENNATIIDDYMLDFCASLPSPINTGCQLMVVSYAEEIVDQLSKGTQPEQVCVNLGLCSSQSEPMKVKPVKGHGHKKN